MEHGGILTYTNLRTHFLDFSCNINPLGISSKSKTELINSISKLTLYPDIKYLNLKNEVAKYLNCKIEEVLLGNGAVEIIDNLCATFDRIIVCPPCFSEYELRAKIRNKDLLLLPQTKDFLIDVNLLIKNIKSGDLLILANPNNPTAKRLQKELLLDIYKIVHERNAFLLLDEAFFEFCPEDYDSIDIFKKYNFENICILRAATKFFALPGIRLGYACTSKRTVNCIEYFEQPWHINSFAEAAAKIIFNDTDFIFKSKQYIFEARDTFFKELKDNSKIGKIKFEPYTSDCNFILIKLLNATDKEAQDFLKKHNILVRTCSSFKTLSDNHIRIAVRSKEDNAKFIQALFE